MSSSMRCPEHQLGNMTQPAESYAGSPDYSDESLKRTSASGSAQSKSLQHIRLEDVVLSPVTDPTALHELLWLGVPIDADPWLRGRLWKLSMGYAPLARECREQSEQKKVQEYLEIRSCYFARVSGELLSEAHGKQYKQIAVDTVRTHPAHFEDVFRLPQIQQAMIHVLLVWAIRNPASGYVQGLNDLITPFIVVFLRELLGKTALTPRDVENMTSETLLVLEAQCYWCLSKLLSRVQDNFVFGQPGVVRMVSLMESIVRRVDSALMKHLVAEEVQLFHVCFRWMNCFFTREIPLEAVLRLWDTYIAEGTSGFSEFHIYVCAVFLVYWSDRLRVMDFQQILLFLQSVPTSEWGIPEMESLVAEAFVLKSMFHSAPRHLNRA